MHLKKLLFILSLLMFTACKTSSNARKPAEKKPPNLVLILVDDLGYADVGFNGCKDIPTPNIDRIAQEGVKFSNGYVTWGACGPSRAGLLTGRYQDRFGFSRNPLFAPNDPNMGLPLSEQTLASALNQANYKSVAIGKWHMGAHPTQRPLKRGFSDFFGFLTGGHRYLPEEWTLEDEYEVKSQFDAYRTKLLRNDQRLEEKEYLTDALSREAVHYIQQYKDDPFFIYLAYNAPHGPLQATQKYLDRFDEIEEKKRKTYAAMVSAVDDGVGLVLDQLEELGIDDNTLVVFLSDNGGPEHKNASDNGPLRGKKGDLYEGGIRVPFAMRWPLTLQAGQVYENPISSLDIFASIVAQNAGKITLKNPIDGVDIIPYLTGTKTGLPHETLFWRKFDAQEVAIRAGNDKYIHSPKKSALFDLGEDLGEQENLSGDQADKVAQLKKKQTAWSEQMIDAQFQGLGQNDAYNKTHPDRFKRPEKE